MIGGISQMPAAGFATAAKPPEREAAQAEAARKQDETGEAGDPAAPRGVDGKPLTPDQQRLVRELQARDREVRAHEAAHKAVGGSLAGGMSFSYQTGPDGRQYAIGGEVQIDTGAERDPRATIAKMQRVIAAALAPADPSPQDRAVAAGARATMAAAQRQLTEQQRAEFEEARARLSGEDDDRAEVEAAAEAPPPQSAAQARLGPSLGGYRPQGDVAGGLLSLIA